MNKNLKESILFFDKVIQQLDYMDVVDRDSMLLEDLINCLKRNPYQKWNVTNIARQITNNYGIYLTRIGELASNHCEFGILTFDRSGMLKVQNSHLTWYCWNIDYVTRLENRHRKYLNFDKHAQIFMENEHATINALAEMLPSHKRDLDNAQKVYDYMTVYLESDWVAPHVTNPVAYKQKKLPELVKL